LNAQVFFRFNHDYSIFGEHVLIHDYFKRDFGKVTLIWRVKKNYVELFGFQFFKCKFIIKVQNHPIAPNDLAIMFHYFDGLFVGVVESYLHGPATVTFKAI